MSAELEQRILDACRKRARQIIDRGGLQALLDYEHHSFGCGCMGPRDGEPYCPCMMAGLLEGYKVRIVNEIDPDAAKQLLRQRIIAALKV